eukprot:2934837-Ditylum_brightwellii.AAC.1
MNLNPDAKSFLDFLSWKPVDQSRGVDNDTASVKSDEEGVSFSKPGSRNFKDNKKNVGRCNGANNTKSAPLFD